MAEIHENEISTPDGTYAEPTASPTAPTATGALGGSGIPSGSTAPGAIGTTGTGTTGSGDGGVATQTQERAAAVADQASTEAANVKDHAVQAAAEVKDQAKGELANITDQARSEARTLASEAKDRLGSQADSTTQQIASTLADIGSELRSLAERSDRPDGPATEVIRQLADRTESFADRLETSGYKGVANDLARYGRNKPGMFLLAAGAAGFLVGRMLRNSDTQALTQSLKGDSASAGNGTGPGYDQLAPVGAGQLSTYETGSFTGAADTTSTGYGTGYAGEGIDLDRPAYDTPTAIESEAVFETETYAPPLGGPGSGRV